MATMNVVAASVEEGAKIESSTKSRRFQEEEEEEKTTTDAVARRRWELNANIPTAKAKEVDRR